MLDRDHRRTTNSSVRTSVRPHPRAEDIDDAEINLDTQELVEPVTDEPLGFGPGEWASTAPLRGQGEFTRPEKRRALRTSEPARPGHTALLALGRAIFGGYFLYNGIQHFTARQALSEYARSKDVPAADAAVLGSGSLILLGGLSLLTGVRPKLGASLITAFLAGVSPKMHNFWAIADEQERMHEFVNFTKNIALVGGACLAAAMPEPWPWSLRLQLRA